MNAAAFDTAKDVLAGLETRLRDLNNIYYDTDMNTVYVVGWDNGLCVRYNDDGVNVEAKQVEKATQFTTKQLEVMGEYGVGPATVTNGKDEKATMRAILVVVAQQIKEVEGLIEFVKGKMEE